MQTLLSSQKLRADQSTRQALLQSFTQLVALASLDQTLAQSKRTFYRRIWCPVITLWYLIWQRLQPAGTLQRVVSDARAGNADALRSQGKRPLSQRIRSTATTAYSNAHQRLPRAWVSTAFTTLAQRLAALGAPPQGEALPVQLLDGSTLRLRPHRDIAKTFPPHRTRRRKSYWCVARVVVSFCATSGVALAAQMGAIQQSEQAQAVRLILGALARALYVGDRNFGVWRVVRATVQAGGHALVRLTRVRAQKLAAGRRLRAGLDLAVRWSPSRHDQVDRGLQKKPVDGRLVVVRVQRRGHRAQTLFLFTTLSDTVAYPPARLLALYGVRWQVELNFRTVKATMGLAQLEVKSIDLAWKEFYAGLMAYNLVRGLMGMGARTSGGIPSELSFATVRAQLLAVLNQLWLGGVKAAWRRQRWEWLIAEAGRARLPRRKRPRPSEPRAQYYTPQVFPKLKTTRAKARQQLKKQQMKS